MHVKAKSLKMVKGSWQIAAVVLYFCKNKLIDLQSFLLEIWMMVTYAFIQQTE